MHHSQNAGEVPEETTRGRRGWLKLQIGEELIDSAVQEGVHHAWCNLRQRREDEGALVQAGVGQDKLGRVEDGIAVEQDVEVDDAGTVGDGGGAVAAHLLLDGEEGGEELGGWEWSAQQGGGVEEMRLIEVADRGGVLEGRDLLHFAEGAHVFDGGAEIGFAVSEVGAEGDGGELWFGRSQVDSADA